MSREQPKSYAERLPPVVPRQESDISHLSDEMAELLYPGWRPRPFRVTVAFDAFEGQAGERAVALARAADRYEAPTEARPQHVASFTVKQASPLRALFEIVGSRPATDVLVDGKRVPYARELWLPLVWLFVTGD
jgi:hypothetical protein